MTKKIFLAIALIFILSFNCYAEGQSGIETIYNIGHFVWAFMCISIYTLFGGLLIKLILYKSNLFYKNQTLKAFFISFTLSILASLIYGNEFFYFLWNLI